MGQYEIRENEQREVAIFDTETGEQVSQWWKEIYADALIKGTEKYYLAQNKQNQYAIFHIDNQDQPVSNWWNNIYISGLLNGKSDYYLVRNNEDKEALFHKDNQNEPISQWWEYIYYDDDSHYYYIAQNGDGKYAIFYVDNSGEPITSWWDTVYPDGLVKGESNCYIVRNGDRYAIFHKDINDSQISGEWYDKLSPIGLVNGTSNCYACKQNGSCIQVYHIDDPYRPLYNLHIVDLDSLLYLDGAIAIYVKDGQLKIYDESRKYSIDDESREYSIAPLSREIKNLMLKGYKIDERSSNKLISDYIHYRILPIVINEQCFIYDLDGRMLGSFTNIEQAIKYIIEEKIINNDNGPYILRLY